MVCFFITFSTLVLLNKPAAFTRQLFQRTNQVLIDPSGDAAEIQKEIQESCLNSFRFQQIEKHPKDKEKDSG